jgi:hypothetical protein
MRALPFAVGVSLLALGLIAPLSLEGPHRDGAVSPARVGEAPVGSRISVLGLVEDVRHLNGGGAAATISDCLGTRARVYFPPGVEPPPSWTLALVEGAVQVYEGARELVAESAAAGLGPDEGALVVHATEIAASPAAFTCRVVALTATVVSVTSPKAGNPTGDVVVEVEAGSRTVACYVHFDGGLAVQVTPGARVTFVGVPAVSGEGGPVTVHVRP